ncbi:MAG: LytTR family transcriptional regulator DNA-binding domain-containing protein [Bacteroidales bacterium]|nr:LytTR family transcriptional regulator DNA-binding domain-containing protein [Bacteroidales bacterium]
MDKNKTDFTSSLWRFGRKWIVHIIFCACFIYQFSHMSVMRPLIPEPTYMEYIFALFALTFLYLHYFLFIPRFLLQKKYVQYFIIAIVSALIWSCCEAGFLKTYLHKYFYSNFPSFVQTKLFIHDIVGISMRNIALLSIYILFSLYEEAVREEKSMKKESAKQLQLLKVKDNQKKDCFIEISQLLYCKQVRNYTHYFTSDSEFTTLSTLKETKELLGDNCIQISRNLLAIQHAIIDQNDAYVTLKNPLNPEKPIILSVD